MKNGGILSWYFQFKFRVYYFECPKMSSFFTDLHFRKNPNTCMDYFIAMGRSGYTKHRIFFYLGPSVHFLLLILFHHISLMQCFWFLDYVSLVAWEAWPKTGERKHIIVCVSNCDQNSFCIYCSQGLHAFVCVFVNFVNFCLFYIDR